ncbi:MAG TPA: translesion DNA synthesis-associated protein ImuA [Rhodocyclaceae bacterium]|nr:translesion DNA synthesis-associated protein ImuA [Rhodocyclaceae bacterium]
MLPQLQDPASPLAAVLQRSDIWVGDRLASSRPTLASGHPALDAELPGGGWPRGALVELMFARPGIGELALVLPALAALTAQDEWVVVQASPQSLFAPAWAAAGVALSRLIVVESVPGHSRLAGSDSLWATEQILRAGSVSAALFWPPRNTSTAQLRRLQVAAEAGGTLAFLLQDEARREAASPAPLRLRLAALPDGLAVHLLKRRGTPLAHPIVLPLAHRLRSAARRAQTVLDLPPVITAPEIAAAAGQRFVPSSAVGPARTADPAGAGGAVGPVGANIPLAAGSATPLFAADLSHALARPDFPQAAA